jgi:arylsulfatase A-like enzyme
MGRVSQLPLEAASETSPGANRTKLRAGLGRVAVEGAGWVVIGLLNSVFVAADARTTTWGARLLVHAIDVSQFMTLATLAMLATLVRAVAPAKRAWTLVAWLGLALLVVWSLEEDLANVVERVGALGWYLKIALSLLLTGGYWAWRRLVAARSKATLPWVSVAAAFGLMAAAHWLLPRDYPGLHLTFAALAACTASAAFTSPRIGAAFGAGRAAFALLALPLASLPGLLLPSDAPAWKQLLNVPSSAAAPYLARLRVSKAGQQDRWLGRAHPEWFPAARARQNPTGLLALPKNGVAIFLTIDALRADLVLSREQDSRLPELARLRDDAVSFSRARSPSPSTLSTVSSVFSGKYYSSLYWTKVGNVVLLREDESVRVPELLTRAGVRTVHSVGVHNLAAESGIGRGFARELKTRRDYAPAAEVMTQLLDELDRPGEQRGFFYAHFVDAHAPYDRGGKRGSSFERYLAELALVDHEIGRLRAELVARRLQPRVVLIVSADHGEAFGEHGAHFHSTTVYDELLRVPLLVAMPGLAPRQVSEPVSLLDVGPTLLDLFGLATPEGFLGQSLLPLLLGRPFEARRPIAADSGRRVQALLFPGQIKAIRDIMRGTHEVYDLNRDPGELDDLMTTEPVRAQRYSAALDTFFERHTLQRPGWEPPWRKF